MQHSTYVWNLARFGNSIMYINLFTMLKQYLFLMYSLNPLDVKIQFLIVLPLILFFKNRDRNGYVEVVYNDVYKTEEKK